MASICHLLSVLHVKKFWNAPNDLSDMTQQHRFSVGMYVYISGLFLYMFVSGKGIQYHTHYILIHFIKKNYLDNGFLIFRF